jgi:hypothetical protein
MKSFCAQPFAMPPSSYLQHPHPQRTITNPLNPQCPHLPQDQVDKELVHKKVFIQGCNSEGVPLVILVGANHRAEDYEQNRKFLVYTLDCMIRLGQLRGNKSGKVNAIFELQGELRDVRMPSRMALGCGKGDLGCRMWPAVWCPAQRLHCSTSIAAPGLGARAVKSASPQVLAGHCL